jgi:hypothetical protein
MLNAKMPPSFSELSWKHRHGHRLMSVGSGESKEELIEQNRIIIISVLLRERRTFFKGNPTKSTEKNLFILKNSDSLETEDSLMHLLPTVFTCP